MIEKFKLAEAKVGLTYFVVAVSALTEASNVKRLRELGFVPGQAVSLLSKNSENALVLVAGSRLAMDLDSLSEIWVASEHEDEVRLALSDLVPGETGIVRQILTDPATRHRLMDMGITRGLSIYVRKLAPFGDPMELHLRGYALSLRKADASMIQVVKSGQLQNKGNKESK